MADELFAEVKGEGATLDIDKAFERLETKGEEPSESRAEKEGDATGGDKKENTQEAPKDSARWAQMRREIAQAKADAKAAKDEATALKNASKETSLPDWWKKQYGDTAESKERYQLVTQKDGELDWIKNNILTELDQRSQAEQSQTQEGEEYVDTQIAEMSEEGLKFDRNSLLKFMVDFQEEFGAGSLLDNEGNYDFRKSLKLMERLQEEEVDESTDTKKQLAATANRSKSSTPNPSKVPVVSRKSLRKGWREMGI